MKIKDEISGLIDDWHMSAYHHQGALGGGQTVVSYSELQCHPSPCCLCSKHCPVPRSSAPWASFPLATAAAVVQGRSTLLAVLPLVPCAIAGAGAGVCWGSS